MISLKNKIVLITGASSGIGLSCAEAFAKEGSKLIIAARRSERLKKITDKLTGTYGIECKAIKLDVKNKTSVQNSVNRLPEKWKKIEVVVNNAGLSRGLDKIHEGKIQDWDEMIDTNIKGLLYVSKAVIPLMVRRNSGHIINIGSIAGHEVYPKGNVYSATKHAVDAITKGMRMDLVETNIRVTTIDPGLVETEFSLVRFRGNSKKAKAVYKGIKPLTPDDVADAVIFAATRPIHVDVAEMILLANNQASSIVIHRTQ